MKSFNNRIMAILLAMLLMISSLTVPMLAGAEISSNDLQYIEDIVLNAVQSLVFKNDTTDVEIIEVISDAIGSDYTVTKIGDFVKDAAVHGADVTLDGEKIASTRMADGAISGSVMISYESGAEVSVSFSGVIKAETQKTFAYTSEELVPDSDIIVSGSNITGANTAGKKLLIVDGGKLGATTIADNAFATDSVAKLSTTIETVIFRNVSYTMNLVRFADAKVIILDSGVTQPSSKKPYSSQIHNNFSALTKLEYISLNEGINYIGFADFGGTTGYFGVVIPDSVKQFGGWAFSGATKMYAVKMPTNTETTDYFMEGGIFYECKALISLRLPEGIKKIADQTFYNAQSLETLILPSTLENITGSKNFNSCKTLEILELPSKLSGINSALVSNYSNVSFTVVVYGNQLNNTSINNIKAYATAGKTVACFGGGKVASAIANYVDVAELYNGLGNSALTSNYYSTSGDSVTISIVMDSGYALPQGGLYFAYKNGIGEKTIPSAEVNNEKTEYTYPLGAISNGVELKAVKVYSENEADIYANKAQNVLDNLAVDRDTTADDLINSISDEINDENINFVWIDPFKKITPVDSADIYLDNELIASTDKQDGGIYATIGIIVGEHTRVVFLEKTLAATTEKFSYTAADKAPDSAFTIENGILKEYKGSYKLVVLPNAVTRINIDSPLSGGAHSGLNHSNCDCISSIETVIVHEKMQHMDWITFSKQPNLKVAIVGSGNLSGMNFLHCGSLKYVKLGDEITTVGQEAFRYCTDLKAIKLPTKLTTLGERALFDSGISDVFLPDTVKTIGNNATKNIAVYGKGETVRFADSVKKAKEYFAKLPVSLETEEMLAESLKNLIVDFETRITSFERTEIRLKAIADIVVTRDSREFVYTVSGNKQIPTHTLNEIVKKIENTVKSMNINNTTTEQDVMSGIISAVDDARVEIIYVQDFDKIRAINGANIYLSGELIGSVPTVDGCVTAVLGVKFKGEKATVIIDEKITATVESYKYDSKAPDSAFIIENDTLKSYNGTSELVIIPSTVKKLAANPFLETTAQTVIIPDTVTNIDWSTFYNSNSLEVVIVSDKVSKLPGMNFKNCKSLKYVKLPSGLQRLGEECFFNTEALETIKIPDTLVYLDRRAFCNSGIYELTLPSSVEVIYDTAFRAQAGSVKHLDKLTILSDKVKYNTGKNVEEPKEDATQLPVLGYGHEVKVFCRPNSTTAKLYNSTKLTGEYEGLVLREYLGQTYLDAVYAAKKIVDNMYSDTETSALLKSFIEKKISNKDVWVEVANFRFDKINISATVNIMTTVNKEDWSVVLTGNKKVLISGYDQLIAAAQEAVNKMTVTDETTKEDVENAIKTAIDSGTAVIKWPIEFAKRKSVHGAVIKVKDQSWDIPGVEGKIAGYINIAFKGKNQNIKLERTISPEIEILKYSTVSNESDFTIVNDKIFEYSGNAEVIVLPKAETIVTGCLRTKPGIKAIIISDGMIGLQSQSFQKMPDLEAVYISDSCTDLGISKSKPDLEGAACFSGCNKLKYVRLSPYTTIIPFYTFSNCHSLTEFYIPEGITKIGHRAFWRVENLKDLVLPSTLTKIGSYTFAGNNAEGVVAFETITVLSDDLEFFYQTEEHNTAGPFCCYTNKEVEFYYPIGAKANYIAKDNQHFNFKINTHEVTQTLSQVAIDLQRLLNDYPITNDTTKEVLNAAIDKLITNNKISYKWTKDYNKVNCDDEKAGLATGKILLTDSDTKLTFSVELNKSISTSTFVDNRTITIYDADPEDDWDDEPQTNKPIDVESEKNNILLYVIIGVGALLLLTSGTIGVLILLKKRKAKE